MPHALDCAEVRRHDVRIVAAVEVAHPVGVDALSYLGEQLAVRGESERTGDADDFHLIRLDVSGVDQRVDDADPLCSSDGDDHVRVEAAALQLPDDGRVR